MGETLKACISILKLRIGVAVAVSALAGLAVTPGDKPAVMHIILLGLAVLLSAASAGAFNHFYERDLDIRMARTKGRPFASGKFQAGWPWLLAIMGLLVFSVGLAWVVANGVAAIFVFLGAFVYGVIYTVWLKRRSVWNIVIGGLSGSFAVLAGAAAVDPGLPIQALILALVLFLWTPPHFWSLASALKDDYAAAGVPMLPVVMDERRTNYIILANTIALVAASLLPGFFGAGPLYMAGAGLSGAWFIWKSIELVRHPGRQAAMGNFFASLIQLVVVLAAASVDSLLLQG
jgi:protoheme IX farnesyltransferase